MYVSARAISRWASAGRWDLVESAARRALANPAMIAQQQKMQQPPPVIKGRYVGMTAVEKTPNVVEVIIQPMQLGNRNSGQLVFQASKPELADILQDVADSASKMATRLVGGYAGG